MAETTVEKMYELLRAERPTHPPPRMNAACDICPILSYVWYPSDRGTERPSLTGL